MVVFSLGDVETAVRRRGVVVIARKIRGLLFPSALVMLKSEGRDEACGSQKVLINKKIRSCTPAPQLGRVAGRL